MPANNTLFILLWLSSSLYFYTNIFFKSSFLSEYYAIKMKTNALSAFTSRESIAFAFVCQNIASYPLPCLPSFTPPSLSFVWNHQQFTSLHFTSIKEFIAYHSNVAIKILRLSKKIFHDIQCDHVLSIVCRKPSFGIKVSNFCSYQWITF